MPVNSANICRKFLPWDRPLLPQAVEYLSAGWSGKEALDLSSVLVLVPTKQAGRRLREALAAHAAKQDQAVFPPRVITLETWVAEALRDGAGASRLENELAWIHVLADLPLDAFRSVFPVDPPQRDFLWAQGLAAQLANLQDVLAEIGLRLADVPGRAGDALVEKDRWHQLAELERRQQATLAERGRGGAARPYPERLRAAKLEDGLARIVMIAVPDPRQLALPLLERCSERIPLEILVFAPEAEASLFDEWGRPAPELWEKQNLLADNFESCVHPCPDSKAQAEFLADIAEGYAEKGGLFAAGIVDPEIPPVALRALESRGLEGYDPEGELRRGDRLYRLIDSLLRLAREDTFSALSVLSRQPDVLLALGTTGRDAAASPAHFLSYLDALRETHLPLDLDTARLHWDGPELARIADWRARLKHGAFPGNLPKILAEIFGHRRFDTAKAEDAAFKSAADAWSESVDELARAVALFPEQSGEEAWLIALRLYGEKRVPAEKPDKALELQGWLELMWEDAPHLAVLGFNDGQVPSSIVGDPFLPERLREQLGLKTNAVRFATDAYYLHALASSRKNTGRFDVAFGGVSGIGDPLRPSRLLLRCEGPELPRRVKFLFGEFPPAGKNPPWTRAWTLRVPPPGRFELKRVSVTSLQQWLKCPFRFYLRHVLNLGSVECSPIEMDALKFGTLCHGVLQAMGEDPVMRDCGDEEKLRRFLWEKLDEFVRRDFGKKQALPVVIQVEAARQRLGAAATEQVRLRAEGWRIEEVERKFELEVDGLTLVGKVDRIDRREGTNEFRILDYKTSNKALAPAAAHLNGKAKNADLPEWRQYGGKLWTNLQLPVYERWAQGELLKDHPGGASVRCGYFNLPRAVTETAVSCWDDYTPELADSAWTCTRELLKAIASGEFWPPAELSGGDEDYDEFAALFHRGAAASIDWLPPAADGQTNKEDAQ